ncbi:MAG: Ig-like domain-containing protein [Candidatus Promineifilaceae bacterium]
MRRSNLVAILLAFLMLLLVLTSAVVFLLVRNKELDQQAMEFSGEREAMKVTRSHLESDLAVLESAYEAARETREASSSQMHSSEATLEAILSSTKPAEPSPEAIEEITQDPAPQLIIFAPSDGDVVRPLETITLYMVAHASKGVDRVEVVIDDAEPVLYPAGGLITFTLPVRWDVPSEGVHSISATATGIDEVSSQTKTVVVNAMYQSEEDRAEAQIDMQLADLASVRFPRSSVESVTPLSRSSVDNSLHLQMLTGWDGYDERSVYSRTIALQAFNFIPSGYDLGDYQQSIEGMLLAYNKPDSAYAISVDAIDEEGPFGRWVGAHELAHRLQDDSFQLDLLDFVALDSDARTALRALIEGEAAFLQYLYLDSDSFNDSERDSVKDALESTTPTVLDTLPMFLRQDFEFAYSEGFEFIQYLYEQGGFTSLDAAWRNPPQSTEQILHPERYLSEDNPQQPHLPALDNVLGEGWRMINEDTFGEFHLREHLAQTLSSEQAEASAAGWGGGKYALYADEAIGSRLLVLRLAWDTATDREEFDAAYRYFVDHRLGIEGLQGADGGYCWEQNDVICLYQIAGDSLIIHASDLVTAETIFSSIILP